MTHPKRTHQALLCGTLATLTVELKRSRYHVTLPNGTVVTIPERLCSTYHDAAYNAVAFEEGLPVSKLGPLLAYCLEPGASRQRLEWACRRLGVATVAEAREIAGVSQAQRLAAL